MTDALHTPQAAAEADPTFVDRGRELDRFRVAFERMLCGRRQVMTVLGEPGIGKTRCAEAFAQLAEDQGALVLWGRCYEESGAPPYWPWVQILREQLGTVSESEVRLLTGADLPYIAALVPEIAAVLGEPIPMPTEGSDSSQARFRTFDAVGRLLTQAARQVPLVLVLDNLHWADAASLSLFEFLTHELTRSRVLMLGTYRDVEVSRRSPLLTMLGGLSREGDVERLRIGGLSQEAIASLARRALGATLPESVIQAIYRQTDGNPLFVTELLKVLIEESADAGVEPIAVRIPDGVREAIGRRLARLSERCNELLGVASVLGRNFDAREIGAAAGEQLDVVLESLEAAARAGIIEHVGEAPGSQRFTHALIRETLYEELPTLERLRWHGRAGDVLASLHGHDLDPVLTRIAHHYYEAATLGNSGKAAEFAMRAAHKAATLYAFEAVLAHCDQAISVLTLDGASADERMVRAYALKGWALLMLGEIEPAVAAFLGAAGRARTLGNAELLADAAGRLVLATSYAPCAQFVPLLEDALALLPQGDGAARAHALAALAFALRATGDDSRIESLVEESLTMARRIGDPSVLSSCRDLVGLALRGNPATLAQRLSLYREHIPIARSVGNRENVARVYRWYALDLMEAGELDELDVLLERHDVEGLSQFALNEYYIAALRVVLAHLRGEWDGLESRIEALLELGRKTRPSDAEGVYGAQMFALHRDRGRLRTFEPALRAILANASGRTWTPGSMLMCAELGLLEEARAQLDRLAQENFGRIPRDDMYVTCLVFCAETCAKLADAGRAAQLYPLLAPYAEQTANHPSAICFGSAALYLALLARTTGAIETARSHFETALRLNRSMKAWPWIARTQLHYGAFLLQRESSKDRNDGRALLEQAEALAGRLGMEAAADEAAALLRGGARSDTFPDGLTAREVEVLRLVAIGRSNKDISAVLSISLNTVATHIRSILNKTGSANRTEAAAYAIRHELHTPRSG